MPGWDPNPQTCIESHETSTKLILMGTRKYLMCDGWDIMSNPCISVIIMIFFFKYNFHVFPCSKTLPRNQNVVNFLDDFYIHPQKRDTNF